VSDKDDPVDYEQRLNEKLQPVIVRGNPFDVPATTTVVLRPALEMETFVETVFGLASDGKSNPKTQMPAHPSSVVLFWTGAAFRDSDDCFATHDRNSTADHRST
jgi:hypothetical protein